MRVGIKIGDGTDAEQAKGSTHSLRYGAARDLAQLGAEAKVGVADKSVSNSLWHSAGAAAQGVADMYAGPSMLPTHLMKAMNKYDDHLAPIVAPSGFKALVIQSAELTDLCMKAGKNPTSLRHRSVVASKKRCTNIEEYIEVEKSWVEPAVPTPQRVICSQDLRSISPV